MLLAVWFDTALRGTPNRLTTNGGGDGGGEPRTAWEGWVLGLCGSTRAGGYTGPAHHERGGWFSPWLRFGGLVVGGAASRGR